MKTDARRDRSAASKLILETTWGEIQITARNGRIVSCDLPFQSLEKTSASTSKDWKRARTAQRAGDAKSDVAILRARIDAVAAEDRGVLRAAEKFVRDLFAGRAVRIPPIELPAASEFTKEVWRVLLKIPASRVLTYGEVAEKAGRPRAARAAGTACGANQIALFIPCHRVVGSGGSLGGFTGGLAWKEFLLDREGSRT